MPAAAMAVLVCAAVAVGVLLLPYGSPAPASKARADDRADALLSIGRPPAPALAARRGIAELLGEGGRSPVAWNSRTGLWGGHARPNWWQSALALLTVVRYAEHVRDRGRLIQGVLTRIYDHNYYKPHATARYNFANEFGDDTAWWGLAWLEASRYELYVRHNRSEADRFLGVAEWDAAYIADMPKSCGGIPWALNRPADAVSSAEFAALTARLAGYRESRGPFHDPTRADVWAGEARAALAWLERTGLVNLSQGTVLDSLDAHCRLIGGAMTYTQGEVADALVQLGSALHQPRYYRQALAFLRFALNPASGLTVGGVLTDRCESGPGACGRLHYHLDIPAYKGVFMLAVADWQSATHSHAFDGFLRAQVNAVLRRALQRARTLSPCSTPSSCQFGFHWRRVPDPSPNTLVATVASQQSALDALIVAPATRPRRPPHHHVSKPSAR